MLHILPTCRDVNTKQLTMNTAHARKKTLASGSDDCGDKLPTECDDHLLLNRYISEIPAARESELSICCYLLTMNVLFDLKS